MALPPSLPHLYPDAGALLDIGDQVRYDAVECKNMARYNSVSTCARQEYPSVLD